jgi:hypothetical protein
MRAQPLSWLLCISRSGIGITHHAQSHATNGVLRIYLIFNRFSYVTDVVWCKAYLERDMVVSGVRAIEKNG